MAIIRPWAIWRRSLYASVFIAALIFFAISAYFTYIYKPADCFDGQKNGRESGIDCGGECTLICAAETIPPTVVWVNSFEINTGQYNVLAYVENKNAIAGAPELKYTFDLLNGTDIVASRTGVTVFPPNSVYPIFEGRIITNNNQSVTETRLTLEPVDIWLPASVGRDQFKTSDITLVEADVRPKLYVEIENTELTTAEDVEIVATIFNTEGDPVTASQTFIEKIEPRSNQEIVFTWPNSIARTVRSCVVPTDVVLAIDLSGSMNNDGENPPQPVTDALAAASSFASTLDTRDQISVVAYATEAETPSRLTTDHDRVAEIITALTIDPVEEGGFTNTAAALNASLTELNSPRHNNDARRVLVLLTDGLPTAPNDEDAITPALNTATLLDQNGIEVYAIGLGNNVDRSFVQAIASSEANAYFAPSREDLASIYEDITNSLCEAGPTKIDVIAKTKTNFAPLRP